MTSMTGAARAEGLAAATFRVDATPPIGSQMAYLPVGDADELALSCRGVVLVGAGDPIVLCVLDWIGIGNEGHDAFRARLAEAAGTTPDRVAVHAVHQHDAPACDFSAERILIESGRDPGRWDGGLARRVLDDAAAAITEALADPTPISHVGWGEAAVEQVASNRRILGDDGRVRAMRMTKTVDPELRAEPEGVIDPVITVLSLFSDERPVAVLSYYACHPQSYYLTNTPSPDFPGIARFLRGQSVPGPLHLHFNGAGGNIGAGKYNDGDPENRIVLAGRLADGMRRAWATTERIPITADEIGWSTEPIQLDPAEHLTEETLLSLIAAGEGDAFLSGADRLGWLRRRREGRPIDLQLLRAGRLRVLHLPGEAFVEFQLAAKAMRPDLTVAVAAYGDYGPGYIGTARAYDEGGYETSDRASNVTATAEAELLRAIKLLLAEG